MMERCGSFRFFLSLRWISMVSVTFWQSISLPLHPLMVIKQKKMDNRVKFYSWLISLLERRRLTFEEIANEWRDANANPEGEELQLRTFHRYRKAIESHPCLLS